MSEAAIQVINLGDERYPYLLSEVKSPPACLYLLGSVSVLAQRDLVAVVGTRNISDYGIRVLHEIIPPLVKAGAVIVSGLAYGVDALSQQLALKHGGQCIAVLGSGLDTIYPRENTPLAREIVSNGGALVSELPVGTMPLAQHFPARNRIISGLAKATLVIEAQEKSGSLITANFALKQKRKVLAVPGSIFNPNQKGTNQLVNEGAVPILSVSGLLEHLNLNGENDALQDRSISFATPEEKLIYEILQEAHNLEEISRSTNLSATAISRTISLMELNGLIKNLGAMRYMRV